MKNLKKFEEKIGVVFENKDLLKTAFTHRSYINENGGFYWNHNERLEFLGDAVLELVVSRFLFDRFPEEKEGVLTSYRSALVNTATLSEAAQNLGINNFLFLSKGEARDIGRARQSILANAFEALIGAIYLDCGYDGAQKFIADNIFHLINDVVKKRLWQDAKSFFQEKAQEIEKKTPAYRVLEEKGPDHNKIFKVGVFLGGELIADGVGASKQEAEQDSAHKALEIKGWS